MEMQLIIRNDADARKALEMLTEYLAKDWTLPVGGLKPSTPSYNPNLRLCDMKPHLPVRPDNILRDNNIETLGQLLGKTEEQLLALPRFGVACLKEVKNTLKKMGLSLAPTRTHLA